MGGGGVPGRAVLRARSGGTAWHRGTGWRRAGGGGGARQRDGAGQLKGVQRIPPRVVAVRALTATLRRPPAAPLWFRPAASTARGGHAEAVGTAEAVVGALIGLHETEEPHHDQNLPPNALCGPGWFLMGTAPSSPPYHCRYHRQHPQQSPHTAHSHRDVCQKCTVPRWEAMTAPCGAGAHLEGHSSP